MLYSAPWLVPVATPVVKDGGVAVRDGRIEAVGPAAELRSVFGDHEEIPCPGVLMPALINAHIHLELSHLTGIGPLTDGEKMCGWIENLIQARTGCMLTVQQKEQCLRQTLLEQHQSGVVLVADIGNEPQSPFFDESNTEILHLREFLAPTRAATEAVKEILAILPDSLAVTAHAPYSTSPALLILLKERARRLGEIYSLHVAESSDEIAFLQTNTGCFRNFLERRGAWDGTFSPGDPSIDGAVMYLQSLGILDSGTLCVHCVHLSDKEIRILAECGSHICLCPGSNRFLRVGRAPLATMLREGLLPAIGTDSLASNDNLDIWREMGILREDHPQVEPDAILAMATQGGAEALHREQDYGSLSPHRKALFLNVELEGLDAVTCKKGLLELLTGGKRPRQISWIVES